MTSASVETVAGRRISERHRLKMLRNSDEYKIANPYKHQLQSSLPQDLNVQLKKIPFLSSSSISMLVFPNSLSQTSLNKMAEALRNQEDRFDAMFGWNEETSMGSEQSEHELAVQRSRKESILAQDLIQTKEEICLNVYEPQYPLHESMFDYQNQTEQDQVRQMQSQIPLKSSQFREVMEEEYENYFAS